jgi:predicted nucleic acid-binding protein
MTPADVPPGPIIVDTDVVSLIAWRRGRHADFEPFLVGRVVAISFATAGELYMGAENANWGAARRTELDLVIRQYQVLVPNDAVSRKFGEVYSKFKDSLGRSGQNDVWTASCALAQTPYRRS